MGIFTILSLDGAAYLALKKKPEPVPVQPQPLVPPLLAKDVSVAPSVATSAYVTTPIPAAPTFWEAVSAVIEPGTVSVGGTSYGWAVSWFGGSKSAPVQGYRQFKTKAEAEAFAANPGLAMLGCTGCTVTVNEIIAY